MQIITIEDQWGNNYGNADDIGTQEMFVDGQSIIIFKLICANGNMPLLMTVDVAIMQALKLKIFALGPESTFRDEKMVSKFNNVVIKDYIKQGT